MTVRYLCSVVMESRSSTFRAGIRFRVSALARVTRVAAEATGAGWETVDGGGGDLLICK